MGINRSESIDDLSLTPEQQNAERADFFLNDRQIVCEIKSLKRDTSAKVEKILQPYQSRPEWPIFYGSWEINHILKYLPNSDQLRREILDAATTAIKELVRKANRQIRETKRTFKIPSADGVLVILNDLVDILSPMIILRKFIRLDKKRTQDGEHQFPEITVTWIISETHYTQLSPHFRVFPGFIVAADGADQGVTFKYINLLNADWAAYNGLPFFQLGGDQLEKIEFESIEEEKKLSAKEMTRHEIWRMQYTQQPYLSGLNEEELARYAEQLISALAPGLLKGATEEQKQRMMELLEPWTHFLEEVNLRGLDMRELSPMLRKLGEKIKKERGLTEI